METTLFIFATLHPKTESYEEAKKILISIIDNTRLETGCKQFIAHSDEELNKLYLYEEWKNEDAITKHFSFDYTKNAVEKLANYLEKETDVIKMKKVK